MHSVDPNYINPHRYLTTRVTTHNIGKDRIKSFYLAEVAGAVALLALLPLMGSTGFIIAGIGYTFYQTYRGNISPLDEKEIYVVWGGNQTKSPKRDFKIYIHPHVVSKKLRREQLHARHAEGNLPDKCFEFQANIKKSEWTLKDPYVGIMQISGRERKFQIRTFHTLDASGAQAQGMRDHMEDLVRCMRFTLKMGETHVEVKMYSVLDGHNGIPHIQLEDIQTAVKECMEEHNYHSYTETATFNALKLIPVRLHEMLGSRNGSTFVLALEIEGRLWVASSGDSRAFIVMQDGSVESLTVDAHVQGSAHSSCVNKVLDMSFVGPALVRGSIMDSRNLFNPSGSKLAMLRSLGDHHFHGKSARPKVNCYDLTGHENYLVMVSDGISDMGLNKEIGRFIHELGRKNFTIQAIAAKTVEQALVRGSKDNLTCLIKSFNSDIK